MAVSVSVVVPLYNKSKHILRALGSIAKQTLRDFEAIVVDDGSTDGGAELAAGFPDRRFRVIAQPNAGPGAARNRGIAAAAGDVIAFLDADDAWAPEYLESGVKLLNSCGPGVAAVTSGYVDHPQGVSRIRMWRARGIADGVARVNPQTPPLTLVHMVAYMTPCTTVARADVLRRWGGFYSEEGCRYGEDAILWLKVLLNEAVCFQLRPLVELHREAAELSQEYKFRRGIEPFLLHPEIVEAACPPELLPVLSKFLSLRARKTAALLGFHGDWRRARELLKRFTRPEWRSPAYLAAALAGTPVGGMLGTLGLRALRLARWYELRRSCDQWASPAAGTPGAEPAATPRSRQATAGR